MLVKNLEFESIPVLEWSDKVYHAIHLMQEHHVSHLAVAHDNQFDGIISENILLDADEDQSMKDLEAAFITVSVNEESHFLEAISVITTNALTILPVIDGENNITGILQDTRLLKYVANFLHLQDPGGLIVLETDLQHYSFAEIIKIIETNDVQITQFNTIKDIAKGTIQITIRLNKVEISDIVSSFQRYDYYVKYYFGEELYTNEIKNNYENLMNYLNI